MKKLKRLLSIFLAFTMILSSVTPIWAEGEEMDTANLNETTYQQVSVSPQESSELTPEETQYYNEISETLKNEQNEGNTVTVEESDNYTVFSLNEETENNSEATLTAVTYSTDEEKPVGIVSYEEIVLQEDSIGNENVPNENATGNDNSSEANEEKINSESNIPQTDILDKEESTINDLIENGKNNEASNYEEQISTLENQGQESQDSQSLNEAEDKAASEDAIEKEQDASDALLERSENLSELVEEKKNENVSDEGQAPDINEVADSLEQISKKADSKQKKTKTVKKGESFENSYRDTNSITITAEELLNKVNNNDEISFEFAKSLGFGADRETIIKNLKAIVDEYKANQETFEEPCFIINGVDLALDKGTKDIKLEKNADGTYSISTKSGTKAYRNTISVDANASVTIVYDEKGNTKIEREVKNAKPTDFVITLDISGSMDNNGGRDKAMFSALEVLIDEILSDKRNTVSLVMFASDGAVIQLDIDSQGVKQTFSAADGITTKQIFDSALVDPNGNKSNITLGSATISELERMYSTGILTAPNEGLEQAIQLFEALNAKGKDRNKGVVLFTDGYAEPSSNEYPTIEKELELIESYGTTIVNVTIGDENDVKQYERYLDPSSESYYEKDNPILQKKVLYYNIPKLSDKELADKVSEIFEVAFEKITTEKKELTTETITDGVLAAYGAKIIETIPEGFELVEVKNDGGSLYSIVGKDAQGQTVISFDVGNLISGVDMTLSYCVIPTKAGVDLGVTSYQKDSETVLYTEPINKIKEITEDKEIQIIYSTEAEKAPHGEEIDPSQEETVNTIAIPGKESHFDVSNTILSDSMKDIKKYAEEYMDVIEEFYNTFEGEAKQKIGGELDEIVDTEKFAEEIRKNGWIEVALPSPFDKDEKAISAAYKALAKIYKKMLLKSPQFSSIDFSNTSGFGMTMIASRIINMVKSSSSSYNETFTYDGYTINLNGFGMFSGTSGKIVISKGSDKATGAFSTSVKKTEEVVQAFTEDLSKVVKDQSKQALFEVLSEFSDVTGIKDFFSASMENVIRDNLEGLEKAGFKKIMDGYAAMKDIYDSAKPIFESLNNPRKLAKEIDKHGKDLYDTIKKLKIKGSSDWFNNDKAVKNALNKIEKARKNLETAVFNYIYEDQGKKEKYEDEKSGWEKFWDLFK